MKRNVPSRDEGRGAPGRRIGPLALLCVIAAGLAPPAASAVCRVVEPVEGGGDGVLFDPTTTVLVVKAPDQIVDYECPEEALLGMEDRPWEREDPAVCPDGVTEATPIRDTLIHVVVQPALYANGGTAGLIMPLPRRTDVNTAPEGLFDALNSLMRIRVRETVEFVEDSSLGYQCSDPHYSGLDPRILDVAAAPTMLYGCAGEDGYYRPGLEGSDTSEVEYSEGDTVEFEAIPVSDDYDATVLNASSLEALTMWLDGNDFAHDAVDDAAFQRYVGEGNWFVAIHVHPPDLGGELRALAPIVVTYRGEDFPITHELSYDPAGGVIETDLFVLAPTKMAVGDGDAITSYARPFELNLFEHPEHWVLRGFGLHAGFLTRMHLERRMADALQVDTKLVEAGDLSVVEPDPIERYTRVRIAQACCPGQSIPIDGERTFTEVREYDLGSAPPDDTLFYRAPPPEAMNCPGGDYYEARAAELGYGTDDYSCTVAGAAVSWSPVLLVVMLSWRRRRISGRRRSSR